MAGRAKRGSWIACMPGYAACTCPGERHYLLDWQAVAGKDAVLVPAGGMGVALKRETAVPDFHCTAKKIEELKSVFPDGAVWAEPAAALLGCGLWSALVHGSINTITYSSSPPSYTS